MLKYYKKAQDARSGRAASCEVGCVGSLVAVEGDMGTTAAAFSFRFTLESKERILSLRAETDVERSSWVCALLAAGATDHPLSNHLSAHVPPPAAASAMPSMLSMVAARSGSEKGGQHQGAHLGREASLELGLTAVVEGDALGILLGGPNNRHNA